MINKVLKFCLGIFIMTGLYFISRLVINALNLPLPPAILGLIFFASLLILGLIKEDWIKDASDFLISNMALFLIPFWGALIVYEDLLAKNALVILLVVFITTILTIVGTGLFVEFGIKYLRLKRIKKHD